jgi:2-C-methyl-D-erythritol 4-phosphate cytidylyltransferase
MPVLMHTIQAMRRALPSSSISIVLSPDSRQLWDDLCRQHHFDSPAIVDGGETRWHSVRNAIDAIPSTFHGIILVHDGARPIAAPDMVRRVTDAAAQHAAAIPATPVTDSLRIIDDNGNSQAVERARYRAVQTPQAFDADILRQAYDLPFSSSFTDDASVVEALGQHVTIVDGDHRNIKITHSRDIDIAEIYLNETR